MTLNIARQRMPGHIRISLRSRLSRIEETSVQHPDSEETPSHVRRVVLCWHSHKITESVRVLDAKPFEEEQMLPEKLEISRLSHITHPTLRRGVGWKLNSSCSHEANHVIQSSAIANESRQIRTQAVGEIVDAAFHSLASREHRKRALSQESVKRPRTQDCHRFTWGDSGGDQRKQRVKSCGQCGDFVQQQPTDNAGIFVSQPDGIDVLKPRYSRRVFRNFSSALGSLPSEHRNHDSHQTDRPTDNSRPVDDTRATEPLTLQDAIAPRHFTFLSRYAGIGLNLAIFSRACQSLEASLIGPKACDAA